MAGEGNPRTERLDDPAAVEADGRPPDAFAPGSIVGGRYRIRALAGEGAGGAVFEAEDLSLKETVALKVLSPPITDATVARFRREVRLTRKIAHPNVVRVHDLVTLEGSATQILTMQWVEGDTLEERVQRHGPLSASAARRLFRGLVDALAAAHRLGIVHRDVKPANVMIDRDGKPLLLDFGIALEPGEPADGVRGTPGFMAPEQTRHEAVGPAADVYALGLTVAFALGVDPAKAPGRELVRCLEARPEDRFRDAEALARALNRVKVPVWAFALLALAIAVVGAAWLRHPPAPRLSIGSFIDRTTDPNLAWLTAGAPELIATTLAEGGDVEPVWPAPEGTLGMHGAFLGPPLSLQLDWSEGSPFRTDASLDLYRQIDAAVAEIRRRMRLPPRAPVPRADPAAFREYASALAALRGNLGAEAFEHVRRALAIDPGFARAAALLTMLVKADGYGSKSEVAPALSAARSDQARQSARDRELIDAVAALAAPVPDVGPFERYFEHHPGDGLAWRIAARLSKGGAREAVLRRWIEVAPGEAEPHNLLGYHHLTEADDAPGAEAEFRRAIALAPREGNYADSLADVLAREGRRFEALQWESRASDLSPQLAPAAVKAAELALACDDLAEAERRLERAAQLTAPESASFDRWVRARASLAMLRRDAPGALRALAEAARRPGLGARAFHVYEQEALVHAALRDRAGAEKALATAQRLAETYQTQAAPIASFHASVLASFEDAEALAALDASTATATPGELALFEARRLQLSGEVAGAIDRLKRQSAPLSESPRDGAPFLQSLLLARLLSTANRSGEARIAYAEAIRRHSVYPPSPDAAYEWQPCLSEAAALFRAAGDEAAAQDALARLARVKSR